MTVTNVHYQDGLVVTGANVTLRNCKITGGGYFGVEADNATGLTMDRCTVIGDA